MITKKEIVDSITLKLGKGKQLSDRTIEETVEGFMGLVTEETELETFSNLLFAGINSANVNLIKDKSDFVKSYKPDKEVKDGEVNFGKNTTTPIETENTELQAKLDSVIQWVEDTKRNSEIQGLKLKVRESVKGKAKDIPEKVLDSLMGLISIEPNTDVALISNNLLETYNATLISSGAGNSPLTAGNGGVPIDPSKEYENVIHMVQKLTGGNITQ